MTTTKITNDNNNDDNDDNDSLDPLIVYKRTKKPDEQGWG